jgi:hypothetical protein
MVPCALSAYSGLCPRPQSSETATLFLKRLSLFIYRFRSIEGSELLVMLEA